MTTAYDRTTKKLQHRLIALLLVCCSAAASADIVPAAKPEEARSQQLVEEAGRMIAAGKPDQAISSKLDPLIAEFETMAGASKEHIYAARTPAESLLYLVQASTAGTGARVLGYQWAYAYFLKSYALVEMHRDAEARIYLDKAIAVSPQNAQFLGELANRYQREKNWDKALAAFAQEEEASKAYSPDAAKLRERTHAMRGRAYVLVELQRLDEAKALYLQCLALDVGDKAAAGELEYIRVLQAKRAPKPEEMGKSVQP